MSTETAARLVDFLRKLPASGYASNKREYVVRCPICGDSTKKLNNAHLYIKLDVEDKEPFMFYCQKCQAKGIVSPAFLRKLRIYDSDLSVEIGLINKHSKKVVRFRELRRSKLVIPTPDNSRLNKLKLEYINRRLGSELGLEDLPKYKIITNLYDLLDANGSPPLTCSSDRFADTLDRNFIGFISHDNNYIIMRNLSKSVLPDLRYYMYNIFNFYDNTKRFYSIPSKVDLLKPVIPVSVAEGTFDILGAYLNMEKTDTSDVHIAVCGVGYNQIFNLLFKMGMLEMDIRLYSDADQKLQKYKDLKDRMPHVLNRKLKVLYNTKSKDFGVPLSKISATWSYI